MEFSWILSKAPDEHHEGLDLVVCKDSLVGGHGHLVVLKPLKHLRSWIEDGLADINGIRLDRCSIRKLAGSVEDSLPGWTGPSGLLSVQGVAPDTSNACVELSSGCCGRLAWIVEGAFSGPGKRLPKVHELEFFCL